MGQVYVRRNRTKRDSIKQEIAVSCGKYINWLIGAGFIFQDTGTDKVYSSNREMGEGREREKLERERCGLGGGGRRQREEQRLTD